MEEYGDDVRTHYDREPSERIDNERYLAQVHMSYKLQEESRVLAQSAGRCVHL